MADFPFVWGLRDDPVWFDASQEPGVAAFAQVDEYRYHLIIKDATGDALYRLDLMEEGTATEELNTPTELSLTVSVDDISVSGLTAANFIHVFDRVHRLYNIFEIASVTKIEGDSATPQYRVIGYDRLNRLTKDLVLEHNTDEDSLTYSQYLTAYLAEQDMDNPISTSLAGIDASILSKTVKYAINSPQTILQAIINLENFFEERSVFWVDPETNVLQWKLFTSFYDQGYRLDFENNLMQIEQETNFEERVTRLYAYGASKDFTTSAVPPGGTLEVETTVNRPVRMSDSDSYAFDYVDDGSGEDLKTAFVTADHITNPDTLKAWATKQLARYYNTPVVYRGRALELSKASIQDSRWMQLGSSVKVTAPNITIQDLPLYVTGVERDLIDINNVTLIISDQRKDWTRLYDEAKTPPAASTNEGFDPNDLQDQIDDLQDQVDDVVDDVAEDQEDIRNIRYLTPTASRENIDPNTAVYVDEVTEYTGPGAGGVELLYWVRPADNTDASKQAIGVTHVEHVAATPLDDPISIVNNGVVCFGVYYVDSALYGVGTLGDYLYPQGDGSLTTTAPSGAVYNQHIATCLYDDGSLIYYFANNRAIYREANDIYVRNSFNGGNQKLQNVAEGVADDDVVVVSQLNSRSNIVYLSPVVPSESITAGDVLTSTGSALGGTGASVSIADKEDPICGVATADMSPGGTYYNSVATHGMVAVGTVLSVGNVVYAADAGGVTATRDETQDVLTKIGSVVWTSGSLSMLILDIQGELKNPNLIESRQIDNGDLMGAPTRDYEITTDFLQCKSGYIEFLSGTNVEYASGDINLFKCDTIRIRTGAAVDAVLTCSDIDGNAAWSDFSTFESSIDHGNLIGLGDDDHTQYHNDARADIWLATKTTTDLAEGTNLYYTQSRFDAAFAAKTTTDLTEGTNLYYTDGRVAVSPTGVQVGANTSAIATNTGNIATNTGNIATNVTNISNNTSAIALNTTHRGLTNNPHSTSYANLTGTIANDREIIVADAAGKPSGNAQFVYEDSSSSGRIGIGASSPSYKIHCIDSTSNATPVIYNSATNGTTGGAEFTAVSSAGSGVFGTYASTEATYGGYTVLRGTSSNVKVVGSGIATEFGNSGNLSGLKTLTAQASQVYSTGDVLLDDGTYFGSATKTGGTGGDLLLWGTDAQAADTQLYKVVVGRTAGGALYISGAEA